MKRVTTTLAISAALALSACKGGAGAAAATKYIPDGAEFVGGIQLSKVMGESGFKAEMEKAMEKEADVKEAIEAMKGCNLDLYAMDQIVMGGTSKEDVAVVVVGAGVGKAENLTCISGKIKEKKGGDKEPITVADKKLTFDDDKASGWIIDDNTIVIASKSWSSAVQGLVDGTGTSALDGGLKDAVALSNQGKHIWFAGKVPAEAAGDLGPAAGLTLAGGDLDLAGGGLGVSVKGKFADGDKATATATELNTQFDKVKPMAGMVGIPQGVVDSVKIAANGDTLEITAKGSKADMDAMAAKMKEGGIPGM